MNLRPIVTLTCLTFFLVFSQPLIGQELEPCGVEEDVISFLGSGVRDGGKRREARRQIEQILEKNPNFRVGGVVTIPVVVNVLYRKEEENISRAKIHSQIDALNRDFRRMSWDTTLIPEPFDSIIGDAEIEFCLATLDPNGLPCSGIRRKKTNLKYFHYRERDIYYDALGGMDAWPTDEYLNIWVGKLEGAGGWGQYPGYDPSTDGIICGYQAVGGERSQSPRGRVGVHEVGHWLDLVHIWGIGGGCTTDFVEDTPSQLNPNFGCPNFPIYDSCTPSYPGLMWMNFMDYSNDNCALGFSNGQIARMHAALAGPRSGILNSNKCEPLNLSAQDGGIAEVISPQVQWCDKRLRPKVVIANFGTRAIHSMEINYQVDSNEPVKFNWEGELIPLERTSVKLPGQELGAGLHEFRVWTSLPNGQQDEQTWNDADTIEFTFQHPPIGKSGQWEEDFSQYTFPNNWSTENSGRIDWTFTSTDRSSTIWNGCLFVNNFSAYYTELPSTPYCVLNLAPIDLSRVPLPNLHFDMAYQMLSQQRKSDSLNVQVSTDCGNSWERVWGEWCASMTTTSPEASTTEFIPDGKEDWRRVYIDLEDYKESSSVLIRFRYSNKGGNNFYLDNIGVGFPDPRGEVPGLFLYPNPASDRIRIVIEDGLEDIEQISILNSAGQTIWKEDQCKACPHTKLVEIAMFPPGVYFVEARGKERRLTGKFVKGNR